MSARPQPAERAKPNYSGWSIDRDELLHELSSRGILPRHEVVVAHHVTYRYPDASSAPQLGLMEVVGHVANERIECVVIRLTFSRGGESTSCRDDGSTYHCTLSHIARAHPVESNDLLRDGWVPIDPFPLTATPF